MAGSAPHHVLTALHASHAAHCVRCGGHVPYPDRKAAQRAVDDAAGVGLRGTYTAEPCACPGACTCPPRPA